LIAARSVGGERLQHALGGRPLHGEQREVVGAVLDRAVERALVAEDVRQILLAVRRVDDDHQTVGHPVDETVVLDRPVLVEDRRVVRLADRELRDVVRRDVADDSTACGPRTMNSPMWLTSNTPHVSRTALCSTVIPAG
jgi:hypothetical protein